MQISGFGYSLGSQEYFKYELFIDKMDQELKKIISIKVKFTKLHEQTKIDKTRMTTSISSEALLPLVA